MPLTYRLTKEILKKQGFILDRQTGSHQIWKYKNAIVVVPYKKKDYAKGTGRSIIKRIAEISEIEFSELCKLFTIKF